MYTKHISGTELYHSVVAGAKKIIMHESLLNQLNVYPIPDSDTGSNLSFTMKCIIAKTVFSPSVECTLKSISSVALEDAYGNSGTIFASFFNGLYQAIRGKDTLNIKEFSSATSTASDYAYHSMLDPEEGTILTVMRAWSDYLIEHVQAITDVKSLFRKALESAAVALEETTNQLSVLQELDIVDAGALGFIYFVEGVADFFETGLVRHISSIQTKSRHLSLDHKTSTYRYCAEFLLENHGNTSRTIDNLKQHFAENTDSVIMQSHEQFTKIHCHTDAPDQVAYKLIQYGQIVKSKVDDMFIQYNLSHSKRKPIGIITDSIADLPMEFIENEHILRIPLQVVINHNTFTDRYAMTPTLLNDLLQQTTAQIHSSQPSNIQIEKSFIQMLEHCDHVLGIFVSSQMSGLFSKVQQIVRNMNSDRIFIVDSKANSATQGLMIHTAVQMIHSGHDIHTIVKTLKCTQEHYKIFVEIPNWDYAAKSGRVPRPISHIANFMGLKVVISINKKGKGIVTRHTCLSDVIKKLELKKDFHVEKYCVVHCNNSNRAKSVSEQLERLLGQPPLFVENVSSIVSAFVGQDSVGIGFMTSIETD